MVSQRVVGGEHLRLTLRCADRLIGAIAFRQPPLNGCERVRAVYALEVNDYQGQTLQLRVEQLEAIG